MKILTAEQIREADRLTIENEPISSIDLMERASQAFTAKFLWLFALKLSSVKIFCGVGNNGGDGLVIGRLLKEKGWNVELIILGNTEKASDDFSANYKRHTHSDLLTPTSSKEFPNISETDIVIDALFGSGLSRPVKGLFGEAIDHINASNATVVAVDIASGLFADKAISTEGSIIKPDHTITFEVPKLTFLLPESAPYVGQWHVVPIKLLPAFLKSVDTPYTLVNPEKIKSYFPSRKSVSHKGDYGRLLLAAGSKGKMGAAVLAARAAFRSGVGLLFVSSPEVGLNILQTTIPEAMVSVSGDDVIENLPIEGKPDAVALGPGIGTRETTCQALRDFLKNHHTPIVLDADALNILAKNKEWLSDVPEHSILTPHPGEFKRLVGEWTDDFDKMEMLRSFCRRHKVHVVLKGAYSAICSARGEVIFNTTGNPGMATAGSGDVLTGIIGSLLAQGLKPHQAVTLGVYLHGLAGDLAKKELGEASLQATDIINFIPAAIIELKRIDLTE